MNATYSFDMSLEEAMTTQRAVRRVKPDPVDDALLRRLVELAMKAPSRQNTQCWEFVVVKNPAVKARLARLNLAVWRFYKPLARWKGRNDPKAAGMYRAVNWQAEHFEEIPVLIVCCFRGLRLGFPPILASTAYGSIYPSVQNLLLAARAVGLGATLVTMPLTFNFLARRALGLPWNVTPAAIVPLGWPKGRYGPTTRRPVGEVVSIDRYGNRAWRAV